MSLVFASILSSVGCISLGWGLRFFMKTPRSIAFLRNHALTLGVYSLACFWFLYKILHLGEADFGEHKYTLAILFSILACLAYVYVPDFLLVRAFAVLGLLSADAVLDAAYMQGYSLRLWLVTGVYLGVVLCLVVGALPYLARTFLIYVQSHPRFGNILASSLMVYGFVLGLSVLAYGS